MVLRGNRLYQECGGAQEPIHSATLTLCRGRHRPSGTREAYNPNPSAQQCERHLGSLRTRGVNVGRSGRMLRLQGRAWERGAHTSSKKTHYPSPAPILQNKDSNPRDKSQLRVTPLSTKTALLEKILRIRKSSITPNSPEGCFGRRKP